MKNGYQISWTLLKRVSRSFYWTLRVLPKAVRPQIAVAYLLARTTDTIADTGLVALERRLDALRQLRGRISGTSSEAPQLGDLAKQQGSPAERVLLENTEQNLSLLAQFAPADRVRVQQVLETITSGQELDLKRFATASEKQIVSLTTPDELDDYTYRVAGCVGEFWTRICRAHLFPRVDLDEAKFLAQGVRFGKGLQLVNILRDLPTDLRQGRCYMPSQDLGTAGLVPKDLLDPKNEQRFRPVYNRWLERAEENLHAGWRYTNTVPRNCMRVRLACAWPILIGVETIRLMRTRNVLEPERRIKVDRQSVKRLMWRSLLLYPRESAWRKLLPEAADNR